MGNHADTEIGKAQRRVLRGEAVIERQRHVIERRRVLGLSTVSAEELLALFQAIQAEHVIYLRTLTR